METLERKWKVVRNSVEEYGLGELASASMMPEGEQGREKKGKDKREGERGGQSDHLSQETPSHSSQPAGSTSVALPCGSTGPILLSPLAAKRQICPVPHG